MRHPNARSIFASLAVAAVFALAGVSSVLGKEHHVSVWLTKIDDGTRKQSEFRKPENQSRFDQKQDEGYALLKESSTAIADALPKHPTRIVLNPSRKFQGIKGLGAAMTDSSAFVLAELQKE